MESRSTINPQAPIRKVNLSLSPENFFTRPSHSPQLPHVNNRNKSQIKTSNVFSSPTDTYAIGYLGDESGKLRFSFKRSSIPKIPHSEINRKSRKISDIVFNNTIKFKADFELKTFFISFNNFPCFHSRLMNLK